MIVCNHCGRQLPAANTPHTLTDCVAQLRDELADVRRNADQREQIICRQRDEAIQRREEMAVTLDNAMQDATEMQEQRDAALLGKEEAEQEVACLLVKLCRRENERDEAREAFANSKTLTGVDAEDIWAALYELGATPDTYWAAVQLALRFKKERDEARATVDALQQEIAALREQSALEDAKPDRAAYLERIWDELEAKP